MSRIQVKRNSKTNAFIFSRYGFESRSRLGLALFETNLLRATDATTTCLFITSSQNEKTEKGKTETKTTRA